MRSYAIFFIGILSFLLLLNSCDTKNCTEGSCLIGEECINGDCVYITPLCEACGMYEGLSSGVIDIALGLPQTYTDVPTSIKCIEGLIAYNYNVEIDVSSLLGAPNGTLVPNATGDLNGNTITITNETYNYSGVADITINGSVVFDPTFDTLTGSLALTDDAVGTITFEATRQ